MMKEQGRCNDVEAALRFPSPRTGMEWTEEIYQRYYPLVFRAAFRVTGNSTDAEDVLQTVFLRLVRGGDRSGDIAGMESYLYRAAVNTALDLVRSRQRNQGVPLEEAVTSGAADTRHAPDRAHSAGEIRDWLRAAVARLSPMAGAAFALRFFEEKSNAEIAEILETSPGTVAVTLHRARSRIEREFKEDLEGI